jgi:hypothetical protein
VTAECGLEIEEENEMDFSYRVSEDEFLNSETPANIHQHNRVFLWGCILLSLVFVWYGLFGQDAGRQNPEWQTASGAVVQRRSSGGFYARNRPLVIIAGVWILSWPFGVFVYLPRHLRRKYQKDSSMQGEFAIHLAPDAVSLQFAGGDARTEWNIFDHWSEKKDVIWLVFRSGGHYLIGLAALSSAQRDELRRILAEHLARK